MVEQVDNNINKEDSIKRIMQAREIYRTYNENTNIISGFVINARDIILQPFSHD